MPVYTTTISQQTTATSAGKKTYPQVGEAVKGAILIDDFTRESLNPTGTITLYTVSVVGTGTGDVSNVGQLTLLTSAAANDAVNVRTSGLQFKRTSFFVDDKSQLTLDVVFASIGGSTTSVQSFIGFIPSTTPLTALPTTAVHMGIFWDSSGTGNYMLSSSDGVTQTTVNTNQAIDASQRYRLHIVYNGLNSATLSLYNGTSLSNQVGSSKTVSALSGSTSQTWELFFFNKTLTTSARELRFDEWSVAIT